MRQAEYFLLDQLPLALPSMIPSTLKLSYAAARALIGPEAILNVPSARDNWGRIISWSVDFGFEKLVKSGQWPFEVRWSSFVRPTGQFLEIFLSHSCLTISQVIDPREQPRDVQFRRNRRLNNQDYLDLPEFRKERQIQGLPHIILAHGHQTLSFAQLGIPNEDHSHGYIYRTPNLMLMPHEVVTPEPPPEDTDIEAVMTLKEEIEKWRRDNGDR